MRIRILTSVGGWPVGAVVDVDAATAQTWIAQGDAERVDVPDLPIETRTTGPADTAMRPPARARTPKR